MIERKKVILQTVHDSDLKDFMKSLGLWRRYKKGKLKCHCGVLLDDSNLTSFKKIDGKVRALCNKCLVK